MIHTYHITGMTCKHCVEKVRNELEKVPGVISAKVTLQPQRAVVKIEEPIEVEVLQEAVANAGSYAISDADEGFIDTMDLL